ncbi:hypothetical protein V7S43_000294 [Phytophthora oleae]|uniref:Crinkler effector protein N-terminal domain-containing protein n=1 Tax=Phytophthora oleae TaxID=2107226 RepID=A0ABD3G5A2_9STRA
MLTLNCAIVGLAGSAFPAEIDEGASVASLKDAIKSLNSTKLKNVDASDLQLFLAKTKSKDLAVDEEVTHTDVQKMIQENEMKPLWTIQEVLNDFKMTGENAPRSKQVHVLVVIQTQRGLWLVTGSVENALNSKGIRYNLYWMATMRIGFYDPTRRSGNKNVVFWYQDKKLCFHVLFKTEDAALRFETDLMTGPYTLGSPLTNHVVDTRVALTKAVSTDLQRIFHLDYVPDDSESPQSTNIHIVDLKRFESGRFN